MADYKIAFNKGNCTYFLCNFLPLFLFPLALLLVATFWAYQQENKHDQQLLKQQQQHNLKLLENHYHQELETVITDLAFLAKQNELKALINQPTDPSYTKQILALEYQAFVEFKGKYDQIRFIDLNGLEQVRVNLIEGQGQIVPSEQLQNKADRNYFTETIALNKGQLYLSAFDLNIENGKIEMPIKPVIRLASPIFDGNDQIRGIVIINFLGKHLLETFSNSPGSPSRNLLVNQQGFWLKGLNPSDEWGHILSNNSTKTIMERFPDAWREIQLNPDGQLLTSQGLFSYTTINPAVEINGLQYSLAGDDSVPIWKQIAYIPEQVLDSHSKILRRGFIIFDAFIAFIWGVACVFLSINKIQRDLTRKQIIDRDEQLINILSTAFDSIITINDRGIIETFNPAACRMFGYQEHEALGQKVNMLMSSPQREFHDTYLQRFIDTEKPRIIGKPTRVDAKHKDGTEFAIDICIGAKKFKGEWVFTGIIRDAAPMLKLEKLLQKTSEYDDLLETCHNRKYFFQHLHKRRNQALLTGSELSVILIDINDFHQINEQHGYSAGDGYLLSIAELLSEFVGDVGSLARYGDNQFIILLPECGANDVHINAENIKNEIQLHIFHFKDHRINKTIFIGTATLEHRDDNNIDQLLHAVDQSVVSAKRTARSLS